MKGCSHLYTRLPFLRKRKVMPLVSESKDWHSDSPLAIPVAYPVVLIPTKKSGTGTVKPESVCLAIEA